MAEKKEEIAVKKSQALALFDMEQDAGQGLEGADKDSYAIPFLQILQATSKAVEKVEGARMSMIMETVNNTLFKEVRVIPVAFSRRVLMWEPRDKGGKYRGQITMDAALDMESRGVIARNEDGQLVDKEGLIYTDTRQHYVLFENGEGWSPAMIAMSRTQVKRSKKWASQMLNLELPKKSGGTYNPPTYARIYKATTEREENDQGKWYSWLITPDEMISREDVYAKAKGFYTTIGAGKVKVDHDQMNDQEGEVVPGKKKGGF